ncbi:GntR family transcriptional regulator [Caldimonas tepidiphila]|uniref:GntR family transcriptional regulator n=1 Tax=Caldimonas tepidiphila TaxID=2315841 RepID=UPI000E5A31DE|nr:GntR family transcriptional regulator [Caldimonas tepidiphila]
MTEPRPELPEGGTEPGDGAQSQTVRAQMRLRELILGGELEAGSRIAELALVERLRMSRTPIRMALVRLHEEGLLELLASGGFSVKAFSEADVHDALEIRGTLEGLAARMAAERGVPDALLAQARDCVARIDELLEPEALSEARFDGYVAQNERFHRLLAQMCGSPSVQRQLARAMMLPFASPNSFLPLRGRAPDGRRNLLVAQEQHRAVLEAIARREGARAEALMREHARLARGKLSHAMLSRALDQVPGAALIRPPAG